jgi:hypothetical protein
MAHVGIAHLRTTIFALYIQPYTNRIIEVLEHCPQSIQVCK